MQQKKSLRVLRHVAAKAKPILAALAHVAFPPRCPACRAGVEEEGALCQECWSRLHFIAAPHCALCGYPFEYSMPPGMLCGFCIADPPPFLRARSVLRYDEGSKGLILGLKYADRTERAPLFARWMARAGADMLGQVDVIIPVPLDPRRLLTRRFNQAVLLARGLMLQTRLGMLLNALKRRRKSGSQRGLSRSEREKNVKTAFYVPVSKRAEIKGKRVLLVDDVMTTGATARACARALRRAGAAEVQVLTIARAVLS